ncbi:hypothetical protein NA57DRAFT_80551 [Rhizodiscina lignyota]|uniref:Uncharacterized protein n=1 Tax=Rhizodiscina lignyota TaxID=1504668 RepID=A0A9P4I732_9PEZI|nr:hypothetical protein NA57DRAFT_80551 [Rhizodiscina lignyota]
MHFNTLIIQSFIAAASLVTATPTAINEVRNIGLQKRSSYYSKEKTFGMEIVGVDKPYYANIPYNGEITPHVKGKGLVVRHLALDHGEVFCKIFFEESKIVESFNFEEVGYTYSIKNFDEIIVKVVCKVEG